MRRIFPANLLAGLLSDRWGIGRRRISGHQNGVNLMDYAVAEFLIALSDDRLVTSQVADNSLAAFLGCGELSTAEGCKIVLPLCSSIPLSMSATNTVPGKIMLVMIPVTAPGYPVQHRMSRPGPKKSRNRSVRKPYRVPVRQEFDRALRFLQRHEIAV